jgi:hypothetical protein
MAARKSSTPTKAQPVEATNYEWRTGKGIAVGDLGASGTLRSGPGTFYPIVSIDTSSTTYRAFVLATGDQLTGGVATKHWFVKAPVASATPARQGGYEHPGTNSDATRAARKAAKATPWPPTAEAVAKAANGRGSRGPVAKGTTFAAAAAHTSKDAARIGEAGSAMHGDKALAGYVVRWPHKGSDALLRTEAAKGEGALWLARCNEHGETAAADTMQACLKLGKRDALATWCTGHGAKATKATGRKAGAK